MNRYAQLLFGVLLGMVVSAILGGVPLQAQEDLSYDPYITPGMEALIQQGHANDFLFLYPLTPSAPQRESDYFLPPIPPPHSFYQRPCP